MCSPALQRLRLTGECEPPLELLAMVQENRNGLLALLEEDALLCLAHEASLAVGRVLPFPSHLVEFLHPSLHRFADKYLVPPDCLQKREATRESEVTGQPCCWPDLVEERAAICEYEAGLHRWEAETMALEEVYGQQGDRNLVHAGPSISQISRGNTQ